ncbi:MAG: hypothetical protein ACOC5E_03345 [Acidobacteriota bacterium]
MKLVVQVPCYNEVDNHADRDVCRRLGTEARSRIRERVSWERAIEALTTTLDG